MDATANTEPLATVLRLIDATNVHDLERLVACFAEDYALESPLHPARSFRGRDQVRRNWTQIFGGVPDLTCTTPRTAVNGDDVWTEMEMTGTRRDGVQHLMRGVFIFGVRGGLICSGRMFLEPVDMAAVDADAAVRKILGSRA